jgi:hypothetical protein
VKNEHPTDPFATSAALHGSTHPPFAQPLSGPQTCTTSSVQPSTTLFRSREQRRPAHDGGPSVAPASDGARLGGPSVKDRSCPPQEADAMTIAKVARTAMTKRERVMTFSRLGTA